MDRKLVILLLSLSAICHGQMLQSVVNDSAPVVTANNIGPADVFIHMNTSSIGTALTTTILGNGTTGLANTDGWGAVSMTNMTVEAHQTGCTLLGTPMVDGTSYATSTTSKTIGYNHNGSNTVAQLGIDSLAIGYKEVTVLSCVTLGPPSVAQGSAVLFDYFYSTIDTGGYAAIQLNNGNCGGAALYAFNIETDLGGLSHSICTSALTPGNSYWIVYRFQSQVISGGNGLASLRVYDTTGAQVGSEITNATRIGNLNRVNIGNNEAGTAAGTKSYFENTVIRFTGQSPWPLGPVNTTQVPVYWAGRSHNNKTSAGTTVATTKALDVPSGFRMVVTCSNENASGQTTGVTSTAGDTFTAAAAVKSAANGQSISQWTATAAAARTAQLFTCTFPSSSFSNVDVQLLSPSSYDTGAVGNKSSGADIASGSYTPSTANGTNIGCAYIQAGQAITPDSNGFMLYSSATTSMGCQIRQSAPNSSQTTTGIHSNTAASMISVGNYKP